MRIMMCYDGSEAARAALTVARRLAHGGSTEVHLVQVVPHDLSTGGVAWSGSNAVDIDKHARAVAEDGALRVALESLAASFECPARVAVLAGSRIGDELVHYARTEGIDLIVIGCREYGPLHQGVGGALARHMVQSRVAPVLFGPMVPLAHLDLHSIPRGCAVFSHDGVYLGDLERVVGDLMLVANRGKEHWLNVDDAFELSVASGLRLRFDAEDLEERTITAPPSAAPEPLVPPPSEAYEPAGVGSAQPWAE